MRNNGYQEMKNRQQERFNSFPLMFAYNKEQFADGMKKLGLTENDTDKIYRGEAGCYYRKSDAPALHKMFDDFDRELREAIESDKTGDGFIYDMFHYELSNHEYSYTGDDEDAILAVGLTYDEIATDARLLHGLERAKKSVMNDAL